LPRKKTEIFFQAGLDREAKSPAHWRIFLWPASTTSTPRKGEGKKGRTDGDGAIGPVSAQKRTGPGEEHLWSRHPMITGGNNHRHITSAEISILLYFVVGLVRMPALDRASSTLLNET
jgi:hypothetical protein